MDKIKLYAKFIGAFGVVLFIRSFFLLYKIDKLNIEIADCWGVCLFILSIVMIITSIIVQKSIDSFILEFRAIWQEIHNLRTEIKELRDNNNS